MAISVVQTVTGAGSGDGVTVTLTLASTTAGNCLVVCAGMGQPGNQTPSVNGITLGGSAGNFASAVAASKTHVAATIWTDQNCAGGQTSLAVTGPANGSSYELGVAAYEVSGLLTSSAVDKTSSDTTANSSAWTSSATATTTNNSEIWFGVMGGEVNATSFAGPSSPWNNTSNLGTSTGIAIAGYQIVSATGAATYSGTFTGVTSNVWACVAATLIGLPSLPSKTTFNRQQAVKLASLY